MAGSGQRFYEDDEAEEILRRAASMSTPDGRMTYQRLIDTAAELGINPEAVEKAEAQVLEERRDRLLRATFDAHQRQGFYAHLATFVLMNACLIFLNLQTSPGYLWFFWPLFGWGIGFFSHARSVFMRSSECYQEEFAKWKAVRESRSEREKGELPESRSGPSVVIGVHVGGNRRERVLQSRIERAKYRLEQIERKGR